MFGYEKGSVFKKKHVFVYENTHMCALSDTENYEHVHVFEICNQKQCAFIRTERLNVSKKCA